MGRITETDIVETIKGYYPRMLQQLVKEDLFIGGGERIRCNLDGSVDMALENYTTTIWETHNYTGEGFLGLVERAEAWYDRENPDKTEEAAALKHRMAEKVARRQALLAECPKLAAFLSLARRLNKLAVRPLLYGSLGLKLLTGEALNADDIDVLLPGEFLGPRWPELCALMEEEGYTLADEHEHAFQREGLCCAFAPVEELESFAGVAVRQIPHHRMATGTHFLLLTLEQYLQVYTASARDGYRAEVRGKKDSEKIALIRRLLEAR